MKGAVSIAVLVLLLLMAPWTPAVIGAPNASVQVIFSGQPPVAQTTGTLGPFGFWIWCQAVGTRPYAGECAGAVYFRDLGLLRSVEDDDDAPPSISGGMVTISVESEDGLIACTFSAHNPPTSGPTNVVTVSCEAPARSGTVVNAVVRVTGP